jgi:hypothetical protein
VLSYAAEACFVQVEPLSSQIAVSFTSELNGPGSILLAPYQILPAVIFHTRPVSSDRETPLSLANLSVFTSLW